MMARIAFALALLLSASAMAQTSSGTGVGVGAGATAVDPSKNVLDALLAAVTRLNDLMAASTRRSDDLRGADIKLQDSLRDAETRRIDQLGAQKQVFDLELARINRANADASALLLATNVKELKTDSAERTGKLEEFANQQRGRSSATDPAAQKLVEDVRSLLARQADTTGQFSGANNLWLVLLGLAGLIFGAAALMFRSRGHEQRTFAPPSPGGASDSLAAELLKELIQARRGQG